VGALNQLVDVAESIEQRVFGVNVKMYEGHGLEKKIIAWWRNFLPDG
jgi:hypothetical protein